MTKKPYRTLYKEILRQVLLSAIIAIIIFIILDIGTIAIIGNYCYQKNIHIDELQWIFLEQWIFIISIILSICAFAILFLVQLKDHIDYIHKITIGIENLQTFQPYTLPLEGNNELTMLASTFNDVSLVQQQLRQKEQELQEERENLIRTLGHDIRTPLTSILSYSEYLTTQKEISVDEQQNYLQLIQKKAIQIKDLTDILLDGHKRNIEYFEDGKLLMTQIVDEFIEELEEHVQITSDFTTCSSFSGNFDVQELRRIFDNLASNILKYADESMPVTLQISTDNHKLFIKQSNTRKNVTTATGYQIGLLSIKRIAQMYNGTVQVDTTDSTFTIFIILHL